MTTRRSIAWILSPVGLLLISAGRLIIVANFNTTTAVTIASSGGFVNTLLGTVIPLVPIFMPYLALLLLLFRRFLLSVMTFVFAAFISPASVTFAEGFRQVKADWNQIAAAVANNSIIAIVIVLVILAALWLYNRSFVEGLSGVVVMVTALTLLVAVPIANLSLPLRLASDNERRLVITASPGTYGYTWLQILTLLAFLAVVAIPLLVADPRNVFSWLAGRLPWLLTGAVAIIATIAFFPYIHFIYPVPQYRGYYTEATHAMWLPGERIELNTRRVYYGYVLSSTGGWFTVLLANSRVIVYLPARDVVARSVCQPMMSAQPKQYPPLVPWLYHPPRSLPSCTSEDEVTLLTSYLSRGESLKEISSIIHVRPERIISITNAYQHGLLSAPLRKYECRHDWNAPTPEGQHFWYYPSIVPY
jgi:hypothetical protein